MARAKQRPSVDYVDGDYVYDVDLNDPKARLKTAEALYASGTTATDATQRLAAFEHSVRLDPFNRAYRLSLVEVQVESGRIAAALEECERLLEFWPDAPDANVLYAEALIEAGRAAEARERLGRVSDGGTLGVRATLAKIECDLRDGDWNAALQSIAAISIGSSQAGALCEKCLKIVLEAEEQDVRDHALALAREKVGRGHKAYRLLEEVARFDPEICFNTSENGQTPPPADSLRGMLRAYQLARAHPISGDLDSQLERLSHWRALIERDGDAWVGLRDAYLHVLDQWAGSAYKGKAHDIARTLWQEARRHSPYNPAVLQNLAIVATRGENESEYRAYWEQAVRAWTLHGEIDAQATGYESLLLQKHRVFAQGALERLNEAEDDEALFELVEVWATELVSLFTIQQLAFRNAFFRCGIRSEDYTSDAERERLARIGHDSLERWLGMYHQWHGLSEQSRLATHRSMQLATALDLALSVVPAAFQFYDDEKAAFASHREYMSEQYSLLVLNVVLGLASKDSLEQEPLRTRYGRIAACMVAFPHELLKPGLLKILEELRQNPRQDRQTLAALSEQIEEDAAGFIRGFTLHFWTNKAQAAIKASRFDEAVPWLSELLKFIPHDVQAVSLLVQCHALQLHIREASDVVGTAQAYYKEREDKEALDQLDEAADSVGAILLSKAMPLLRQKQWAGALTILEKARQFSPRNAHVSPKRALDDFSLSPLNIPTLTAVPPGVAPTGFSAAMNARLSLYAALCYAHLGLRESAEVTAKHAREQCPRDDEELVEEVDTITAQLPDMVISDDLEKAVPLIKAERWREAIPHLKRALEKVPDSATALFYMALCKLRVEDWAEAERFARQAASNCKTHEDELREQCEAIIEQVPIGRANAMMSQVESAMKYQNWGEALRVLDQMLGIAPKHLVALFYKAKCELALKRPRDAEATAKRGLSLVDWRDVQFHKLFDQIIEAANAPAWVRTLNEAVEHMNNNQWDRAGDLLDEVLRSQSNNAQALYYRALCKHQSTMRRINAGGPISRYDIPGYINTFQDVDALLTRADRNTTDSDLEQAIRNLKGAVQGVLSQLRMAY